MGVLFLPDDASTIYPVRFLPRDLYDADTVTAIAAVEAAGGTLTTAQKSACDTFIRGLKTESLWSSFYGLYLFVGASSGAHAVNWKQPGTHTITWVNSPTHDSGGVKGNGTTSYGSTGTLFTSVHGVTGGFSTYLREAVTTDTVALLGTAGVASVDVYVMDHYATIPTKRGAFGKTTFARQDTAVASGFFTTVRRSPTDLQLYRNGASIATSAASVTAATNSTYPYFLGARNAAGTPDMFNSKYIGLQAVHASMTTAQVLAFYGLVQALQTAFGRQV